MTRITHEVYSTVHLLVLDGEAMTSAIPSLKSIELTHSVDGHYLKCSIKLQDDTTLLFEVSTAEYNNIILPILIGAAANAAHDRRRGIPQPMMQASTLDLAPVTATDLGMMYNAQTQMLLLALRFFDFDLGFQLQTSDLRKMSTELRQIADLLDAKAPPRSGGH